VAHLGDTVLLHLDIRKTQFTVSDFLKWQREGSLQLNPTFQRRSVWKPAAKSLFLDTVLKGLPAPVIYLRENIDLKTHDTYREVVDGQQRLRTLFTYINPKALRDFDSAKDSFSIRKDHNAEIGGLSYRDLDPTLQKRILGYEFSTHLLPLNIEDRQVLQMFARLNSTGVKLNHQELRNAEYFGAIKTLMYDLAMEQLERWRDWNVFSNDEIARMLEVELVSDLAYNIVKGLSGRSQERLGAFYEEYEDEFPGGTILATRFRRVMDEIDDLIGDKIATTVYASQVYFFTLFVFLYDRMYSLGSALRRKTPENIPSNFREKLLRLGERFDSKQVPEDVMDAVIRASSDFGRRETRLEYMERIVR
jgi:hypothetical protein